MLGKVFGSKREEVTGRYRVFRSGGLHDLYCSSNTTVIKWRRIRWAGCVARMVENTSTSRFIV